MTVEELIEIIRQYDLDVEYDNDGQIVIYTGVYKENLEGD